MKIQDLTPLCIAVGLCWTQGDLVAQSQLPTDFVDERVLSAGEDPATFAFSPDGHLYYGERVQGRLFVALPDSGSPIGWRAPSSPFFEFDIPSDGAGNPARHRSSGLRDIAFHPNFPNEPWVYAFFMRDEPRHNRVVRVRVSSSDPTIADASSLQVLIDLPYNSGSSSGSHNGGALEFGADGMLYVATGDGWNGGDPVQSLSTWTGKVLRLNPDGSIPTDNPFYGSASGDFRAIYALGCRNPFSMSADPTDGALFLNETNGPNKTNIFQVSAAANFEHQGFGGLGVATSPFVVANNGGKLNTGGAWYEPSFPGQTEASMPFPTEYHGSYFVAQWGGNDGSGAAIARVRSRTDTSVSLFASEVDHESNGRPVLTRVGPDGHLYYLATDYETSSGAIYRVRWNPSGSGGLIALPTIDPNGGNFPMVATVDLSHSDSTAEVRFTLDGSDPTSASSRYTQPLSLTSSATLRARAFVGGTAGPVASADFLVGVADAPPVCLAGPDFVWPRGRLVTLNGSASFDPDGDDAELTDNWVQIGGPALLPGFDGSDFLSYFNPVRVGTYTFRLDTGDRSSIVGDVVSITIVPCLVEVLDDLSSRWAFAEGSGSMAGDSSPGADHGTIRGASWVSGGPRPHDAFSLSFDGQNDRVDVPEFDATGSVLTVALWVRPDDFGIGDARFLSKADGTAADDHDLMLSTIAQGGSAHVLRVRLRTSGVTRELRAPASSPLAAGQWQHVALVYDGSTLRLFQDGQQVVQRAMTGDLTFDRNRPMAIGNQPEGAGDRAFDGRLADVRTYGRALSANEVQQLASLDLGTTPTICACDEDLGGQSDGGAALIACTAADGSRVLRIEGGPPNSIVVLLVGAGEQRQSILDGAGTLVPIDPAPLILSQGLDVTGVLQIPLPPAAGIGSLYLQAIHRTAPPDTGAFSATNAVRVEF